MARGAAVALVVAVVAGFLFVAFRAEGNRATQVDLNDAGIWLSRTSTQEIGRLNTDLKLVDVTLKVLSQDFELLQSGGSVLVRVGDVLRSIDVRIPQPRGETVLPPGGLLDIGGETAAVLEPTGGGLWIGDGITIGTTDYVETQPDLVIPDADDLVVGVDGEVHVFDRESGSVHQIAVATEPQLELDAGPVGDSATVTAVGDQPVVLSGATLFFGQTTVDLSAYAEPLYLQEAGPESSGVVLASNTQLLQVDFETGFAITLSDAGTGQPAVPVVVDGCAYGAWSVEPVAVKACGEDNIAVTALPQMMPSSLLKFRVNRERVALNQITDGGAILFTDGEAIYVNDWSQALSEDEEEDDDTAELEDEAESQERVCDRDGNKAPVAVADNVVTRQGRPIVIRPLSNDSDANCDVLTIELEAVADGIGEVALIEGNRAIQYTPPPERTTKVVIRYSATDGIASSSAEITIEIEARVGANEAPITTDDKTLVTQGRTVTHNVLLNDRDPDGDALAIKEVGEPDRGGKVRFRPDGQVVYTAPGDVTGAVEILYVAVDESGATASGTLTVEVRAATGNALPVARSDHAFGFVGDEITVNVLENDSDADGDTLRLSGIEPSQGAVLDFDAGTVTVAESAPGSRRFTYLVSDGFPDHQPVEGALRIDVYERGGQRPPVAVRYDVVVIPGVPTVVDVLANDYEPDGDVLVVRSVEDVPQDLTVEIIDRSLLRVTAELTDADSTLAFRYRVSDGTSDSVGLVVVRPMLVGGDNQAPIVVDDSSQAHAGGIISIPVLENDYDPEGDVLVLESASVREPQGKGLFTVDEESLRFLAPVDFAGTVTGTYVVFDGFNRVSGTVRIRVKPATAEDNLAPRPPLITARTFVGQRVRIPLPLSLMDPDGDPVEILGLAGDRESQPTLGQVTEVTSDMIEYLPFDAPESVGTDRFAYRVRDSFGAEGAGIVEVGIVPFPSVNGTPVAVDDEYVVPIGARVVLQPLLNDSDPEGSALRIVEEDLIPPQRGGVAVVADGSAIEFTSPDAEDVVIFGYSIADPGGARDSATIEVKVVEKAENLPPVAVDDIMEAQAPGTEVVVAVLENDRDPDGSVTDLTIEVIGLPDTVVGVDGSISFTMPSHGVNFAYVISDPEDPDLSSTAIVQVPVLANRPPVVPFASVTTPFNESVSMDLLAQASDPDGDDLSIVPDSFRVDNSSGFVTIEGNAVVFDPDDRFSGEGGFSYTVTDGVLSTVGSVRVVVEAPVDVNESPAFTTTNLEVPAAGQRTYDLQPSVVDPDDDTHTFRDLDRGSLPSSISVRLSPSGQLTVEATDPGSKDQGGQVRFTVDDGNAEGTVTGSIGIIVIGSDKPPPVAKPDGGEGYDDLRQGTTAHLDVLSNDFDPFQNGTLEILSFGPVSPEGAGDIGPALQDNRIVFTPSDDFHGTATIPYTIGDETKDPDRTSSTTVTVNIKGKPDAPGIPTGTAESRQATLQWPVPSANGAPITGYEVRDESGTVRCTSTTNSCTTLGLTNGDTYRFRVRAINEVGPSPDSDLSAPLNPDQKPDTPAAPTTQFGDGEITVSWTEPNNEGSAITGYTIRITPGGRTEVAGANSRSFVWTGLDNGTPYSFEVLATNQADDSEWSQGSAFDVPAGVPLNLAAPNLPQAGDRIVTVTWDEPNTNGAAIQAYELTVFRDGSAVSTLPIADPGNRSYTVTGASNGSSYQFAVRAQNKAGWSDTSSRSAAAIPSGVPFGISNLSAAIGNGSVTLSYSPPNDNGAAITHYEVAVGTSSDPRSFSGFNGTTVGGLQNGQDYWFRVRACNINGCSDELSNVASGNPCTAPSTPVFGPFTYNQTSLSITWHWSIASNGGRTPVTYTPTGGGINQGPTTATSFTKYNGNAFDTPYTLSVQASTSCPVASQSGIASQTATIPAPYFTLTSSTSDTCPEVDRNNPVAFNPTGPTCANPWVPRNSTIYVVCRATGVAVAGENQWLDRYNSNLWINAWGINYGGVPQC